MSGFHWDWAFAWSIVPQLAEGVIITVIATALGSVLAFLLGLVWAFVRIAQIRVVTPAVWLFVQFIRGTPLLIQLYFLFYVLPTWGVTISTLANHVDENPFMKLLGKYAWGITLAVSIGVPIVTYLMFEKWLLVPLPKGPIENWLGL